MSPSITSRRPARPPHLRPTACLVTTLLLGLAAAGCTNGDDKKGADKDGGEGPNQPPATAEFEVKVAQVAGTLRPAARQRLAKKVKQTLEQYVDGAFLGEYPRSDFDTAFAAFTPGAAKRAKQNADVLTGASYSDVEAVGVDRASAALSVLAPEGSPAGVTAKVLFALDFDGTPVTYKGKFLLTQVKGNWRIFGYTVSRDDNPTGPTQ